MAYVDAHVNTDSAQHFYKHMLALQPAFLHGVMHPAPALQLYNTDTKFRQVV